MHMNRLYEQDTNEECIGEYVKKWVGWVNVGLGGKKKGQNTEIVSCPYGRCAYLNLFFASPTITYKA